MTKHCISALRFSQNEELERKSFEIYVTDCLKHLLQNTSYHMGLDGVIEYGTTLKSRWIEVIEADNEPIEPLDERPCDEIAQDIFARIRGE